MQSVSFAAARNAESPSRIRPGGRRLTVVEFILSGDDRDDVLRAAIVIPHRQSDFVCPRRDEGVRLRIRCGERKCPACAGVSQIVYRIRLGIAPFDAVGYVEGLDVQILQLR